VFSINFTVNHPPPQPFDFLFLYFVFHSHFFFVSIFSILKFKFNFNTVMAITLYTFPSPNGTKISITLEELKIEYEVQKVDIQKDILKEEWFVKINSNGRLPVIVDHSRNDFKVFEPGAILLYLVEHYDHEGKLCPKDSDSRSEVIQWLMFQMTGLGATQSQATHFHRVAPEKIEYGIKHYTEETKRLYLILEKRLEETQDYLAAHQYTIADIANFIWVRSHDFVGLTLEEFPRLQKWVDAIESREAVKIGLNVPELDLLTKLRSEGKL